MDNKGVSALEELKNHTQQGLFQSSELGQMFVDVDWKFAHRIDLFLSGQVDSLPGYSMLDKLRENAEENIISVGSGVIISLDNDEVKIEVEEPIRNSFSRVDCITGDSYYAYVASSSFKTDFSGMSREYIDVSEMPRFRKNRVEFLQNYLGNYKVREQQDTTQK